MHPFLNKCSQTLTIFKIIAVKFKLFVKFVFVSTVLPKYRWKKRSMTSISLFSCFSAGTTVYVRLNAFWKCLRFKFGNLGWIYPQKCPLRREEVTSDWFTYLQLTMYSAKMTSNTSYARGVLGAICHRRSQSFPKTVRISCVQDIQLQIKSFVPTHQIITGCAVTVGLQAYTTRLRWVHNSARLPAGEDWRGFRKNPCSCRFASATQAGSLR